MIESRRDELHKRMGMSHVDSIKHNLHSMLVLAYEEFKRIKDSLERTVEERNNAEAQGSDDYKRLKELVVKRFEDGKRQGLLIRGLLLGCDAVMNFDGTSAVYLRDEDEWEELMENEAAFWAALEKMKEEEV